MTRLSERFTRLKHNGEAGLICFITAGDPDLATTERLVLEMDAACVDAVELGIPFSDPLADGKTIQSASERALKHHVTIEDVLQSVARLRRSTQVPLVLMTYCNPVLQYGLERFARRSSRCGVDGVIITDLPPEEGEAWIASARRYNVDTIFLLAPTSTRERIRSVSQHATGFIYCVSRTGVTGAQEQLPDDLNRLVAAIRRRTRKPIGVGFGISRPEHARAVIRDAGADAVVVGSALINLVEECRAKGNDALAAAHEFVCQLKQATRSAG
jgi:tryptophan synthase alpha chain